MDIVIRAERAVIGDQICSASVGVSDGVIREIGPLDAEHPAARQVDIPQPLVLLPGLVDTHVHISDPGTDWEGFCSATAAAAAAGITTLIDMPLDSDPVTTSTAALEHKRDAARGACSVDVGFWGGVIPDNLETFDAMAVAGVLGFKCFLADSGNPSFPPLSPAQFRRAMTRVASLDAVMLVHAESGHIVDASPHPHGRQYSSFLRSRPDAAEVDAVTLIIDTVRRTGARAHIVHVSSGRVLPLIAAAKRGGLPVTAETCPHYLIFAADEIADGGTQFAACPPIRRGDNRQLLWTALGDGVLDMIVSDHSPSPQSHKGDGDFGCAFAGISSLEIGPRAVWTRARMRGYGLPDLCRWMAERPAALAGLTDKGRIAVGYRADFAVFDPNTEEVIRAEGLNHRHPVTPYDGVTLRGAVLQTWLGGQPINSLDNRDSDTRGTLLSADRSQEAQPA